MLIRVGMMSLSLIQEAFDIKARGGTDAAGIKWPTLKPETIAYGRRHPGLDKKRARAAADKRPLLTGGQNRLWCRIFVSRLRWFQRQGMDEKTAKGRAAAIAWKLVKERGGQTILEVYGATKVDILRDTAILRNSFSPALPGGNPAQVLRAGLGEVTVGTNVPYAGPHQYGKRVPLRQYWPANNVLPPDWRRQLMTALMSGIRPLLIDVIEMEMRRAA